MNDANEAKVNGTSEWLLICWRARRVHIIVIADLEEDILGCR
jgi:hypothetical protein